MPRSTLLRCLYASRRAPAPAAFAHDYRVGSNPTLHLTSFRWVI